VRMGDLAAWQGVDKSTVTIQLRRLVDRGLVDREVDPDDRRAVLVRASARGRELQASVTETGARVLAGLLADWPAADRRRFAGLFRRFTAGMGRDPAPR
jgi:DNA-binding MarR family transcriptional regulator